MELTRHPERLDRLAASYALGTLRGGARRRFEAIARQSPTVRATTLLWHERLISITELQPSQQPHPNVWKRIANAIAAEAQPPTEATRPRGYAWWRMGALAGALATLVAVAVNVQLVSQLEAKPEIQYVAVLADDKAAATLLATFDPKRGTLTLKRVGNYREAADKSLQLWAITAAGKPQSLGVLGGEPVIRLQAFERLVRESPALAVSLEPKGGVPGEGGPTGPVLFKGAVLQAPI